MNGQIINCTQSLTFEVVYKPIFLICIVLNIDSARFIQAVSEMEFLGFVKSTKQKTDHVARLTWGGC